MPHTPRIRTGRPACAFTLAELVLGLLLTSFIGAALAAFMLAMGQSWASGASVQSLGQISNATALRVQRSFGAAKYVGSFRTGSLGSAVVPQARVFYWKSDDWTGATDSAVQLGEMALLDFDRTSGQLRLYQATTTASMSPAQLSAASGAMTFSEMSVSTAPDVFKALNFVKSTVVGRSLTGVKFDVRAGASTTELPSLDFTLQFDRADQHGTEFGTATMRSPTTQPQ